MSSALTAENKERVLAALERLLSSPTFLSSERQSSLLRYLVERTLAGDALKEAVVGVEVYQRGPGFDPKADSIVRVEASRLRQRLANHYAGPGRDDSVRIELPRGGYTCAFHFPSDAPVAEVSQPARAPARMRAILAVAAALLVVAAVVLWTSLRNEPPDATVTVAPFVDLAGDPFTAALAKGLTEETAASLARYVPVRMAQPGKRSTGALLEATLQRDLGRIRVTAKLVRGGDGAYLWAETFELAAADPLTLRRTLAEKIAGGAARPRTPGADEPAPLPEFLEAHGLLRPGPTSRERVERAVSLFQTALAKRPDSSRILSGLAAAYLDLADHDRPKFFEWTHKAEATAEQAARIEGTLAEAHHTLGAALFFGRWDYARALEELSRAVELNPRRAHSHRLRSDLLCILGRFEEAAAALTYAQSLEPADLDIAAQKAMVYFHWRKYDEAAAAASAALKIDGEHDYAQWVLAMTLVQLGRAGEAEAILRRLPPHPSRVPIALAHLLVSSGRAAEAAPVIAAILSGGPYPYGLALIRVAEGRRREAVELLDAALSKRDLNIPYMQLDPRFDPVRGMPEFRAIARRAGLPGN